MEQPDTQQVCLNGHQITSSYHGLPDHRKDRCSQCGEPTIYQCINCSTEIPGRVYLEPEEPSEGYAEVPGYCEKCGGPFPWTQNRTNDAVPGSELEAHDPLSVLTDLCQRFRRIAMPLLQRRKDHPPYEIRDEYDVQDLLHTFLRVFFTDIRKGDFSPSCAGKNSIIDFLLLNEQIAVEVKMAGETESQAEKRVGEELILDIAKYKEHPNCKSFFCFVYDPWHRIGNPDGLQKDVEKQGSDEFPVTVVITPA